MKLPTGDSFRGGSPRTANDKLPEGSASHAMDCRLLSGSLESWKEPLEVSPNAVNPLLGKTGLKRTLHIMDPDGDNGGPFFLHWNEGDTPLPEDAPQNFGIRGIVDVARTPNAGDQEERTAYTGTTLGPRLTTLSLATDAPIPSGENVRAYPYRSVPLGVRKPNVTPTVSVQGGLEEGEISIENPSAENFTNSAPFPPADWTNSGGTGVISTHGAGDVAGLSAADGVRFFYGGTADARAYQAVTLADANLVVGQVLRIEWKQARGANSSKVGLGVEFYDVSAVLIASEFSPIATVSPLKVWVQQTLSGSTIPTGTVTIRIVQEYDNVGGGETDAYVDDIKLFAAQYDQSFDGSSLSGWENEGWSINALEGRPLPSFGSGAASDDEPNYIYRNIASQRSPKVEFRCDLYKTDGSEPKGEIAFLLFATAGGKGSGIALDREGGANITAKSFTAWDNGPGTVIQTLLGGPRFGVSNKNLRVRIDAEKNSANSAIVTVNIFERGTGITILDTTVNIPVDGDYIGFRFTGHPSNTCWVDEINISVAPPVVADDGGEVFTQYVFTYIDGLGRESAPSLPSQVIALSPNTTRAITTPTTAITGYGIVSKRIYRAATGTDSSGYLLLAEIPLSQAVYTDTLEDEQLGSALQSDGWDEPPSDMFGIIAVPRFMVGFSKNQVCFSVIDQPHAWPSLYRRNTDFAIVGGAVIDNDIFVFTRERPYIAQGTDPSSMDLQKLSKPIGCVSRRSIVVMSPYGVVYASSDGLSYANRSDVDLLTRGLFTEKEWKALNPASMSGTVHDGKYYGFYDATGVSEAAAVAVSGQVSGGFILDPAEGGFGLTWISLYARALFSSPVADKLYIVRQASEVVIWNEGANLMPYTWDSRHELVPYPTDFAAAFVDALDYTNLNFRLFYDGAQVINKTPTASEFVLSDRVCNRSVFYRLSGTSTVRRPPSIATDMEDLD